MTPVGRYFRARLHRRLFAAFGMAILVTGLTVTAVMSAVGRHTGGSWAREVQRATVFVGGRFERAWDDPAAREDLARAMARDLDVGVRVTDAGGRALVSAGPACAHHGLVAPVRRGGRALGSVEVCPARNRSPGAAWRLALVLAAVGAVLWALAGRVSRALTRPLTELVSVVQDIGLGRLTRRVALRCDTPGEFGRLAYVVNEMAARITRQLDDQRQLLAAVSHEIRAPLARMRFVLELARGGEARALDELEQEMDGIDTLVGDLLANARVDFGSLSPRPLDAEEVSRLALERAGETQELLTVEGDGGTFQGDPALVACALANLLQNARKHGGGVRGMRVRTDEARARVVFSVDDGGEGFAPEELAHAFEPFYRGAKAEGGRRVGVGLGLALVKRIAEAHGGRAWATNLPEGGARVALELPRDDARGAASEV